jgi:hypothetical protein
MGRTPDRYPGIREEEAILITDSPTEPTEPFTIARVGGKLRVIDDLGPYDPRGGGALPAATEVGQMLFSFDGSTFQICKPVVADDGFVVTDDDGHQVVTQ